jgi:cell division protein ZapA
MPLVNVLVNNRAYTVACDEGEEEHLRELARFVDGRVRKLVETVGQAGDARLLLMASLLIADELCESVERVSERDREIAELRDGQKRVEAARKTEDQLAEVLEKAAREIEDIAAGLARA